MRGLGLAVGSVFEVAALDAIMSSFAIDGRASLERTNEMTVRVCALTGYLTGRPVPWASVHRWMPLFFPFFLFVGRGSKRPCGIRVAG